MSEERVFLRSVTSAQYGLGAQRRRRLEAPRVVRAKALLDHRDTGYTIGPEETVHWVFGPGDEPFLTQSLQVHFVELGPGGANTVHGHQNEAAFYVLDGRGHEIHDGTRYDWSSDDLVVVHDDSVHQHFNDDADRPATMLVFKSKAAWMYLGLFQQGRPGPAPAGTPADWSALWTPGAVSRKKVVKPADAPWARTRDGEVRVLASAARDDVRLFSVDLLQQRIGAGGRSATHWHMADEIAYVMAGSGRSVQYDVEAEIAGRYTARIATEPSVWPFAAGDFVYVPQNTAHRYEADEPVTLLVAQSRLFTHVGYGGMAYLEEAS